MFQEKIPGIFLCYTYLLFNLTLKCIYQSRGLRRLKINSVEELLVVLRTKESLYLVFMYIPGVDSRHVVSCRNAFVFDSNGPKIPLHVNEVDWSMASLQQIYFVAPDDLRIIHTIV